MRTSQLWTDPSRRRAPDEHYLFFETVLSCLRPSALTALTFSQTLPQKFPEHLKLRLNNRVHLPVSMKINLHARRLQLFELFPRFSERNQRIIHPVRD